MSGKNSNDRSSGDCPATAGGSGAASQVPSHRMKRERDAENSAPAQATTAGVMATLIQLPGLDEWVDTLRPQRTSVPESNRIILTKQQGLCLLQLQAQYDFIVYLFLIVSIVWLN